MTVIALDPGTTETAWVILEGCKINRSGKSENRYLCDAILTKLVDADQMVIEKVASYGMPVGAEVFETVFWSGRFAQAFYSHMKPCWRMTRGEVKMHLCHSMRAKDANVRAAIIDRFGGVAATKKGGPLYKVSGDVWAALAVGLTWHDLNVRSWRMCEGGGSQGEAGI